MFHWILLKIFLPLIEKGAAQIIQGFVDQIHHLKRERELKNLRTEKESLEEIRKKLHQGGIHDGDAKSISADIAHIISKLHND